MLIPVLLTALAAASLPSPDDADQDSVVATAPATTVVLDGAEAPVAPEVGAAAQSTTPHGLSTDQQIAQWLAARSASPDVNDESPVWRDDRKMHGEVSVGVGTGGYRDYAAAVSLPIGDSGRLDISIRQTENDPYGYGYGAGYDPYFADGGYAFPGQSAPGAAIGYERHMSRPDGPPWVRPGGRPQQVSEE
ncbi:hypothetical protein N0B44_29290 [Roseibacterium beibuensis]|uniref:hypothetical protein n=1 Tax=[Roseibacterium] beibuensis TaxID=1193142 RepID=UPI00217D5BCC|nr:hypothetical protein [Roseibacterium beibuensis]MCS6627016.1 hypothetical protein [Roseibacterium beibuensis]